MLATPRADLALRDVGETIGNPPRRLVERFEVRDFDLAMVGLLELPVGCDVDRAVVVFALVSAE